MTRLRHGVDVRDVKYVFMRNPWGIHMQTITATDLARHTRQILDQVASRGEHVLVERNHTVVAHILPPARTMTAAQALDGLVFPVFTPAQASTWLTDSKQVFTDTVRDPWA